MITVLAEHRAMNYLTFATRTPAQLHHYFFKLGLLVIIEQQVLELVVVITKAERDSTGNGALGLELRVF